MNRWMKNMTAIGVLITFLLSIGYSASAVGTSKNTALLEVLTIATLSESTASPTSTPSKEFKVLAIGNSFSEDATKHLYQIAQASGATNIIIGNLYIGGCSLQTHWACAQNNSASYTYYKNTNGSWTTEQSKTILYGITNEAWDIITLQQVSGMSGVGTTYNSDLTNLITYVNSNKLNKDAKLAWHMTWAYQKNSTHADFPRYGNDQITMFNAITSTVQSKILPLSAIEKVIPSGTAIQNVRTSVIGDTLTRDGYHLSLNLGRYIAGLTWLKALTGWSIDDITYVPNSTEIPAEYLPIIKEAVNAAIIKPYAITQSSYGPVITSSPSPTATPSATPSTIPQLSKPSISGITSSTTTIKGKYRFNGSKITIYNGSKSIGSSITINGNYTIKIAKQKLGTKLTARVSKSGYKSSATISVPVFLQKPTVSNASSTSLYVTGLSYAKSAISIYLGSKKLGNVTATSKGFYKVKLNSKIKKGQTITLKASFNNYKSTQTFTFKK